MKWQAVVDRFEGEIAVLQCFDPDHNSQKRYYTVEMPRVLLPQELKKVTISPLTGRLILKQPNLPGRESPQS